MYTGWYGEQSRGTGRFISAVTGAIVLVLWFTILGCANPTGGGGGGGDDSGDPTSPGDGTTTTYSVTYDANDAESGTVPVDSNSYSSGDTVTVLENTGSLSKTGETFVGWNLAQDGTDTNYSPGVEFTIGSADVTLYARFTSETTYTVTFNSNGGSSVANQTVVEGETAVEPVDPTRSGFQFNEWQTSGSSYDFNTAVNSDITLVAVWTEVHTVTFDSKGGSSITSQSILNGETATEPTAPTRNGYDFVEWQNGGSSYDFNTAVNSDLTLDAVWDPQTLSVSGTVAQTFTPSSGTFDTYDASGKLLAYDTWVGTSGYLEETSTDASSFNFTLDPGADSGPKLIEEFLTQENDDDTSGSDNLTATPSSGVDVRFFQFNVDTNSDTSDDTDPLLYADFTVGGGRIAQTYEFVWVGGEVTINGFSESGSTTTWNDVTLSPGWNVIQADINAGSGGNVNITYTGVVSSSLPTGANLNWFHVEDD